MLNRSSMILAAAALFATAGIANAGVTFSTHKVATNVFGGFDEWEIDVSALTGTDNVAGNGITSLQGTLTANTGTLLLAGTSAAKRQQNFSNGGNGQDSGTSFINLDSFASPPVFTPATSTPTSVSGWGMFTTDPTGFLNPSTSASLAGLPANLVADVYVTTGTGTFTLAGQYNTVVANNVAFSVSTAVVTTTSGISLSATGTATAGPVIVLSGGANNYAGQVLKLATPANTGVIGITDIGQNGETTTGTEVLLWTTGTDSSAALATALGANAGGATIINLSGGGLDADATRLLAAYTTLGTAQGLGAPTLLLRFPNTGGSPTGAYNNFFNFTLPAGDFVAGITAVPEPASLGLMALGGLGLLARRRSSKK